MAEDGQIVRQVLDGDVDAFRLLVDRYAGRILAFVRTFLGRRQDCEDVAQDVFFAAYRGLASFDPLRGGFAAWLFAIARNRCLNAIGAAARPVCCEPPEPVDPRTPYDDLAGRELFERLDEALARLPQDQRTAFILVELAGLSCVETAHIEAVQAGTIRSRLSRARAKLRDSIRRLDGVQP